jgi:hypothetical protein
MKKIPTSSCYYCFANCMQDLEVRLKCSCWNWLGLSFVINCLRIALRRHRWWIWLSPSAPRCTRSRRRRRRSLVRRFRLKSVSTATTAFFSHSPSSEGQSFLSCPAAGRGIMFQHHLHVCTYVCRACAVARLHCVRSFQDGHCRTTISEQQCFASWR